MPTKIKPKLASVYANEDINPNFGCSICAISLVGLHMANADSFPSAPLQPHGNQDAIKTTITDGFRLANETSQRWQEHSQSDQQQPLTANGLNSRNHLNHPLPNL